jgi:hypothetical protein
MKVFSGVSNSAYLATRFLQDRIDYFLLAELAYASALKTESS